MPLEPADNRRRPPSLTARHTLGSDPEAAGTPPLGVPEPSEREPAPAGLARPVWWVAAQERAGAWNESDETRKVAQRAVAQVDQMWAVVDEIERVALDAGPQEKPPLTHFREFLNRELVGLFGDLAQQVSFALARERGWQMAQFDESAERFGRYFDVARLAASDAGVPWATRTVIQRANLTLLDSLPDLAALVGALAAVRGQTENSSRHS